MGTIIKVFVIVVVDAYCVSNQVNTDLMWNDKFALFIPTSLHGGHIVFMGTVTGRSHLRFNLCWYLQIFKSMIWVAYRSNNLSVDFVCHFAEKLLVGIWVVAKKTFVDTRHGDQLLLQVASEQGELSGSIGWITYHIEFIHIIVDKELDLPTLLCTIAGRRG